MTDHPRDAKAAPGLRAALIEIAAVKIGIGQDRLARDFVERDVLRGKIRRGGDHERVTNARRKPRRPRERLHAAQASAHHCRPALDAEPIGKARLRVHPILDGNEREFRTVRLAGRRLDVVQVLAGPWLAKLAVDEIQNLE